MVKRQIETEEPENWGGGKQQQQLSFVEKVKARK